jgi:excisionase family DNA binding protein
MNLLNEKQVSEKLGVKIPCLRRWRHERRGLPFVRVGRLVRYRLEDLEAFVAANRQEIKDKAAEVGRG